MPHAHHPYLQDEECWSYLSPFHTCPLLLGRKLPIQVSAPAPLSALCFPRSSKHTSCVCCWLSGWRVGFVFFFSLFFYFSFCSKSACDKFLVSHKHHNLPFLRSVGSLLHQRGVELRLKNRSPKALNGQGRSSFSVCCVREHSGSCRPQARR